MPHDNDTPRTSIDPRHSSPGAGQEGPSLVFAVAPRTVFGFGFGFGKGEEFTQTRWRFG